MNGGDFTAGGQQGVNFWDKAKEFRPIVQHVENELGRAIQPFHLKIDYVYQTRRKTRCSSYGDIRRLPLGNYFFVTQCMVFCNYDTASL